MTARTVPYSYAVLHVVPHPYQGESFPVGVVLQSRPAEFIGMKAVTDAERLRTLAPELDIDLLVRYLRSCVAIAEGDETAGEIALLPPPERFHWLTAPRSDVIQPSALVHGTTDDPARTLEALFEQRVGGASHGNV